MGLNRLCTIRYLNLDARSVNSRCENCVNIARLFEFQTRRASRKYIARGMFFDSMLESTCERIPFYYSRMHVDSASQLDPSEIGTLCEELVSDYDDQIIGVLQKFADGSKENVEQSLCVDIAHACSKKEYKRVREWRECERRFRTTAIATRWKISRSSRISRRWKWTRTSCRDGCFGRCYCCRDRGCVVGVAAAAVGFSFGWVGVDVGVVYWVLGFRRNGGAV